MAVAEVELGLIDEPSVRVREEVHHGKVLELVDSIRRVGLLNALTVRRVGERFEVVAGHHRLLALRLLGVGRVPVVVVDFTGDGLAVAAAHENLCRQDMSVREEARLVAALMGAEGVGVGAVARQLGRSEGWVRDRMEFLTWPEWVGEAVAMGQVALGVARALMGIENELERDALFEHAVKSGCTVATARRWREDANLGRGVSGQSVSLVGVDGAVVSAPGPRTGCFFCGVVAAFGDLIYVWAHRECAHAMGLALDETRRGASPPDWAEGARPAEPA